jgi:hypothetical protein
VVVAPGVDARAAVLDGVREIVPEASALTPAALVAKLVERAQVGGRGTLLFIDQLEELATLSRPDSAAFAVDVLREIGARPLPGVRAVVAARRDLLDPLLAMTDLGKVVLRGSVLVESLADSTWSDVIDRALGAYGYGFEDAALRDEVLGELAHTAEAMPLVQFALTELWHHRDAANKRLTRAGLSAIGGVAGALGRHADATLARILAEDGMTREAARALLLSLTTARGTRATRTRAELKKIAGSATDVILERLEAGRLIVTQATGITLAHDALISSWGTLSDWLAEERDWRLLAEDLERAARSYQADPAHAPLWRKQRLEDGERLARGMGALSDEARAFLLASRRNERRRRLILLGTAVALLVLSAGFAVAYVRAVTREQDKTAAALRDEKASRQVAERRAREIQEAQAKIDQLLKNLAESPKKEEIVELQRRIRTAPGAPEPPARTIAAVPERRSAPVVSASPTPAAAAPKSATPGIKIQSEW